MNKKPYIGFAHDDERIIVSLFALMASHTDEAYLLVAQRVPSAGVDLANVKVVVRAFDETDGGANIVFVSPIHKTFYTSTTTN